jgi:hypothetical protein
MKRYWLFLLSIGLIMVFSTSAHAVDVQFSGSIYIAGLYLDKTYLQKDPGSGAPPSTAFFYQRLRVKTDFVISPGLSVVTRFDALERVWGGRRSAPGIDPADIDYYHAPYWFVGDHAMSAGTQAENENIAFDWAYIQYASPVGLFRVGYQEDGTWGTIFGDTSFVNPRIYWELQLGNWTVNAAIVKLLDNSYTATNNVPHYGMTYQSDADSDKYLAGVIYKWKSGEAGLQGSYIRSAMNRVGGSHESESLVVSLYELTPYAKAKIGSVDIQAELIYVFGSLKYDTAVGNDYKIESLAGWIDATVKLGMVYFGGSVAYVSGDDPDTFEKIEGEFISGGRNWDPCLILFNYNDRGKWVGPIWGYAGSVDLGMGVMNAWLFQGRIGVKPIPKLDILASVTYATVDKKESLMGNEITGSTYGTEVDLTATYKITNNLTYMLGGGYLFTGDYFKGIGSLGATVNSFLLINKLTLTF